MGWNRKEVKQREERPEIKKMLTQICAFTPLPHSTSYFFHNSYSSCVQYRLIIMRFIEKPQKSSLFWQCLIYFYKRAFQAGCAGVTGQSCDDDLQRHPKLSEFAFFVFCLEDTSGTKTLYCIYTENDGKHLQHKAFVPHQSPCQCVKMSFNHTLGWKGLC